jgi:integrase
VDKPLASGASLAYPHFMAERKFIRTKHPGVYYRESLTKTNNGKPDRCFVVWFTDAKKKGHWRTIGWASAGITERYALAKRQELLVAIAKGDDPVRQRSYTVGDAVAAYELWARAEGKSIDREMSRYNCNMRADLHDVPLVQIDTMLLTTFKAKLLMRLAPGTVAHCFSFLRRAVYHSIALKLFQERNPFAVTKDGKWKLPKVENSGVRFLSPDEAAGLLDELAKRSPQLHDMSLLSLKTGLRSTEIFSIKGQDVQAAAGVIHFTAKGGKRQFVHAPESIIEMILNYHRRPGEYIFQQEKTARRKPKPVGERKGGKINWGISDTFKRAVDALGLNDGVTDRRDIVWFHTWRHTYASWLAQSGKVTLLEIKELLRHESINMTVRYAHLIPGHQSKTQGLIDEILASANPPQKNEPEQSRKKRPDPQART